jgi:hypothetical protein
MRIDRQARALRKIRRRAENASILYPVSTVLEVTFSMDFTDKPTENDRQKLRRSLMKNFVEILGKRMQLKAKKRRTEDVKIKFKPAFYLSKHFTSKTRLPDEVKAIFLKAVVARCDKEWSELLKENNNKLFDVPNVERVSVDFLLASPLKYALENDSITLSGADSSSGESDSEDDDTDDSSDTDDSEMGEDSEDDNASSLRKRKSQKQDGARITKVAKN